MATSKSYAGKLAGDGYNAAQRTSNYGNDQQMGCQMSRYTLRFESPATESFFIKSRAEALLRNYFWISAVGIVCTLLAAWHLTFNWDPPTAEAELARGVGLVADFICCGLGLKNCLMCKSSRLIRLFSNEAMEICIVMEIVVVSVLLVLIVQYSGAKVIGYDPAEIYTRIGEEPPVFTDTRFLLAQACLLCACHMALPIRWLICIPMELAPSLVYAGCVFIFGGPEGRKFGTFNLMMFICFTSCAVIGRRTIEYHERLYFVKVIEERSLRVQTEFKLERLEDRYEMDECSNRGTVGQVRLFEDQGSIHESRPSTTDSGNAFKDLVDDQDFMHNIVAVGTKEQWIIGLDEMQLLPDQILGMGSFGVVVAGLFNGTQVAVKTPKSGAQSEEGNGMLSICNELRILRRLRHPNIVFLYGACLDTRHGDIALVLERVHGDTLEVLITRGMRSKYDLATALTMVDRLQAIVDVCCAIRYLHSRHPPIVHGDLKGSNIFMEAVHDGEGGHRAKLLDFGLSRLLTKHAKPLGGSLTWMAPEVVQHRGKAPHCAADVFSFGRLAYFVFSGVAPLQGKGRKELIKLLKRAQLPPLAWPEDPEVQRYVPLFEECCQMSPQLRPRMAEVSKSIDSISAEAERQFSADHCHSNEAENIQRLTSWHETIQKMRKQIMKSIRRVGADRNSSSGSLREQRDPLRRRHKVVEALPTVHEDGSPASDRGTIQVAPDRTRLALPDYKATNPTTYLTLIMDVLDHCNFHLVKENPCCNFHASLTFLQTTLARLSEAACQRDHFDNIVAQCATCGLMLTDEEVDESMTASDASRPSFTCFLCNGGMLQLRRSDSMESSQQTQQPQPQHQQAQEHQLQPEHEQLSEKASAVDASDSAGRLLKLQL